MDNCGAPCSLFACIVAEAQEVIKNDVDTLDAIPSAHTIADDKQWKYFLFEVVAPSSVASIFLKGNQCRRLCNGVSYVDT